MTRIFINPYIQIEHFIKLESMRIISDIYDWHHLALAVR